MGPSGDGGPGAAEREAEGGEVGGDGAGPGGSDDRWLRLLEEPFDGLTVRPMSQFPGQLKDPGCALGRHPDPPAPPVHLSVSVLGGGPLRRGRLLLRWRLCGHLGLVLAVGGFELVELVEEV